MAGNVKAESIAAIMRDTGTMAFRLNKPLTVRLFPIPIRLQVKYQNLRVMIYVTAAFYIFRIELQYPYFVVMNIIYYGQ